MESTAGTANGQHALIGGTPHIGIGVALAAMVARLFSGETWLLGHGSRIRP